MIKQVDGNLIYLNVDIIAHQVNCLGVMGAGIALQIKRKYPEAMTKYKDICDLDNPSSNMGLCQIVDCGDKLVANLFGQQRYGKGGRQTDYRQLRRSLEHLKTYARDRSLSIGIPHKIGCGLAGGDWKYVKKIIEEVFHDYPVTICKYKG